MLVLKVSKVMGDNIEVTDGNSFKVVNRENLNSLIDDGKVGIDNLKIKCVRKQRNKHNIIEAYMLENSVGETITVTPDILKDRIYNYQVDCVNLRLTSNGRLIDREGDFKNIAPAQAAPAQAAPAQAAPAQAAFNIDEVISNFRGQDNEIIVYGVYTEIIKALLPKYNDASIYNINIDALNGLFRLAIKNKELANVLSDIGVKPLEYSSEHRDHNGGKEVQPNIKLGLDISSVINLLFGRENVYLPCDTPLETNRRFFNIENSKFFEEHVLKPYLPEINSYFEVNRLAILYNEDLEIIEECSESYYGLEYEYDLNIECDLEDLVEECREQLSGSCICIEPRLKISKRNNRSMKFGRYAFYNNSVKVICIENNIEVVNKIGLYKYSTEYTVRDPKTLDILEHYSGDSFMDAD